MPPYQNENLHDMHGLLKQLDTLNAAHAPEHLEMFEGLKGAWETGVNTAYGLTKTTEDKWKSISAIEARQRVIEKTLDDIKSDLKTGSWESKDYDALKSGIQSMKKGKAIIEKNIVAA